MPYLRGKPGRLVTFGIPPQTLGFAASATSSFYLPTTYVPGQGLKSEAQLNDEAATFAATLQAGINAGNPAATAATISPVAPSPHISQSSGQQYLVGQIAQTNLVNSQAGATQSVVPLNNANAYAAVAQGTLANSQATVADQQAKAVAADTYQQVQGGGISSQFYNALPWLIGGVVAIGVIGWILHSNKSHHRRRRK